MNDKKCFIFIVAATLLAFHVNSRAMDENGVETKGKFLIPLGITGGLFFFQYVWGKTVGSKEMKELCDRVKQCENKIEEFRKWHDKNDSVIDAISFVYSPGKERGSFQGSSELANKFVQALNYLEELRAPGGQMELAEKFVKEQSEKATTLLKYLYDKKIPTKLCEHDELMKKTSLFENGLTELEKAFKVNTSLSKSKLAELRKDFRIEISSLENEMEKLKIELNALKHQRNLDDESDE